MQIDWNIFKVKHKNYQAAFETLAYQLFCSEFNQNNGIFSYKDQVGIETEPITLNGACIGFQAKFYETKISENIKDIKDSIDKAKDKNPLLNKVLLYTNQKFSESTIKKKKDPDYKIKIEEHAQSKQLEIEWRVPSHIERQLALDKNKTLAKYFFSQEKCVLDLIVELQNHTESLLTPIHSEIIFKQTKIKFDRSFLIEKLEIALDQNPIVIIRCLIPQ